MGSSRPSRIDLHMLTALMWSTRSVCKRRGGGPGNGAVITTPDLTQVLSIGYNGPARGVPHDHCTNEVGNCLCLHAEENAIIRLRSSEAHPSLFTTSSPCVLCAQRIIQRDIEKVFYLNEYRSSDGLDLLRGQGVQVMRVFLQISPDLRAVISPLT